MKKAIPLCVLAVCILTSCRAQQAHEHVPDSADCQHVQYCIECGGQLAEQGPHDYSDQPQAEQGEYEFFVCSVCGKIEIVNKDGIPVVPVD